jgi:hypothetical protein
LPNPNLENGIEIPASQIWAAITGINGIDGYYDEKRPNELQTGIFENPLGLAVFLIVIQAMMQDGINIVRLNILNLLQLVIIPMRKRFAAATAVVFAVAIMIIIPFDGFVREDMKNMFEVLWKAKQNDGRVGKENHLR